VIKAIKAAGKAFGPIYCSVLNYTIVFVRPRAYSQDYTYRSRVFPSHAGVRWGQ